MTLYLKDLKRNNLLKDGKARGYGERNSYIEKYSFAIPDKHILKIIGSFSPIIEAGAGSGYWGYELAKLGYNVVCIDKYPGDANEYLFSREWYPVFQGDHRLLEAFNTYTLFVCWPPYDKPMDYEWLTAYRGKVFLYLGESAGNATGTAQFFEELDKNWVLQRAERPIQWYGMHDYLYIYKRR